MRNIEMQASLQKDLEYEIKASKYYRLSIDDFYSKWQASEERKDEINRVLRKLYVMHPDEEIGEYQEFWDANHAPD